MARKKKGIVLAVDLGTETTLVSFLAKDGHVEVVSDPDGNQSTPTAIGLEGGDPKSPLYGLAARSYRKMYPENVCVIAKRVRGQGDAPGLIDATGKAWSTEDLEAEFLSWRLKAAEALVGESVAGILATVPAAFNDAQRRATQEVVEKAGYKCVGIINEPTAALLEYAKDKEGTFAVADIGGGTFDVNVLRVEKGNVFTTLATGGQDDLGGREYTLALVQLCVEHAAAQNAALDPAEDMKDMVGIELACEVAKRELTSSTSALVSFRAKERLFDVEITREQFEGATAPLNDAIVSCFNAALESAELQAADLDGVIFAGGGSRVPGARIAIEALVGEEKVRRDINPDTAIVTGACRAIGMKLEERRLAGDADLVGSVAQYLLKGDVAVKDVIGTALGVAALRKSTDEQVLVAIVAQGASLPATGKRAFGLTNGGTGDVNATITVLEGEKHAPLGECHSLAEFSLEGMPAGPIADRIEIAFEVNGDGLVSVHAIDTHSGMELREKVDAAGAVSKPTAT